AALQPLFDHVRAAAFRTLLGYRLTPRHESAVRITVAAIERLAALGAAFDDLTFRAIRTFHSDGFLLDVLAGRIIAARRELAEPAEFQDQTVAALRANFVQRDVRFLLRSADGLGGLAVRISGAGVELAEATLLEDHRAAAVFAILLFALLAQVCLVDV